MFILTIDGPFLSKADQGTWLGHMQNYGAAPKDARGSLHPLRVTEVRRRGSVLDESEPN